MIGLLRGTILDKQPPHLLLEVQGVGYELEAPMTTFYDLPPAGGMVTLYTHLAVREDAHLLYGFAKVTDRDLFRHLLRVNGVGAKLALTILSGMDAGAFAGCIQAGDSAALVRLPGVGRKTAERLVLELKPHVSAFLAPEEVAQSSDGLKTDGLEEDVVSALVNLGYPKAAAEKALAGTIRSGRCERNFEDILKNTLRQLSG